MEDVSIKLSFIILSMIIIVLASYLLRCNVVMVV
jgi:hypothetical protein